MGRSDVDRLISGDGAIGDSPRGKAVALNRGNRCVNEAEMETIKSEGRRTRQHTAMTKQTTISARESSMTELTFGGSRIPVGRRGRMTYVGQQWRL